MRRCTDHSRYEGWTHGDNVVNLLGIDGPVLAKYRILSRMDSFRHPNGFQLAFQQSAPARNRRWAAVATVTEEEGIPATEGVVGAVKA